MRAFNHEAITSPFFRLAEVFEFDILADDESFSWRVEVLESVGDEGLYRYHAWDMEHFRLRPSFPQTDDGEPEHETDDLLYVNRALPRQISNPEAFPADSLGEAVDIALQDLRRSLEHITGTPAVDARIG